MAGEPYGRVVRTFWTDPDIKPLPREQKELLLYFCTSPHATMIGVYHCPLEYAAKESGTPLQEVLDQVQGPLAKFLTYDFETEEVYVHALAKHNIGDTLSLEGKNGKPDNRIKSVEKLVETVHSPLLRELFLRRYAKAYNLSISPSNGPLPPRKGSSKPLSSPSEAIAVAVAGTQHNSTLPSEAADAARKNNQPAPAHTMGTVLRLVVEKLYFGTRPSRAEMKVNASVLKTLSAKGQSWDLLARAVEGLALRRDRGEIKSITRTSPVSCKWLWDKDQVLNQVAVSEDALYRAGPDPPGQRRGGAMSSVGDLAQRIARRG